MLLKPRVLIIDDSQQDLDILWRHLTRWEYDADKFYNPFHALIQFDSALRSAFPYKAIVLDVVIPGSDGLTIAKEIRRLEQLSDRGWNPCEATAIIFCSGFEEFQISRQLDFGKFGVIDKNKFGESAGEFERILGE